MDKRSLSFVTAISLAVACNGGDATGVKNTTVSCGSGSGTPLSLSKGAYTSLDPTAGSACALFAANSSTTDSAEYLLVPQSAAGTPAQSSAFLLQVANAAASSPIPQPAPGSTTSPSFHHFLLWPLPSR